MEAPQFDIFISHAHGDREQYIVPLARAMEQSGITFWLDTVETGWGEDFVGGINRGLASARFMLFCLSRNFMGRRWPEAELWATLAAQARDGQRRVLPLILNSKEEVFARYPLLGSTTHLEFNQGIDVIAHANRSNDRRITEETALMPHWHRISAHRYLDESGRSGRSYSAMAIANGCQNTEPEDCRQRRIVFAASNPLGRRSSRGQGCVGKIERGRSTQSMGSLSDRRRHQNLVFQPRQMPGLWYARRLDFPFMCRALRWPFSGLGLVRG